VIRNLRPRVRDWRRREEGLPEREKTARSIGPDRPELVVMGLLDFGLGQCSRGEWRRVDSYLYSTVPGVSCSVGIVAAWTPTTEREDDEDDWMSPCLSNLGMWCGLTRPLGQLRVCLVD
jgi:hypothetical protein